VAILFNRIIIYHALFQNCPCTIFWCDNSIEVGLLLCGIKVSHHMGNRRFVIKKAWFPPCWILLLDLKDHRIGRGVEIGIKPISVYNLFVRIYLRVS